jgi:hypothetical protein
MTNKTQELPNFSIYENGDLVQAPLVERIGNAAVTHVQAATAVLGRKLGEYATELYMPAYLEAQDAKLGTSLRAEYFERKRELATAALREEVGL